MFVIPLWIVQTEVSEEEEEERVGSEAGKNPRYEKLGSDKKGFDICIFFCGMTSWR